MAPPFARTRDEAQLYLDLHPCERCGSIDVAWESALVSAEGALARSYFGRCPGCGVEREVVFRLPDVRTQKNAADLVHFGGPEPSELLDPGEWLWVADLSAANVPVDGGLAARRALAIAAAAMDEILKFVPPGADRVPAAAFWSERGLRLRDQEPGRFRRERLAIVRDSYRSQLPSQPILRVQGEHSQPPPPDWDTARGPVVAQANELLAEVYAAREAGRFDRVEELADRIAALRERYVALLPARTVARCPYTGAPVEWPLDDGDLDGWFWRYDAPARRLPPVPPTWTAMTGAMSLRAPLTPAPFECRPGPGVPFVVPRLLGATGARAVLAEVPVGRHVGWAVTYFGTQPPREYLVRLWGAARCPVVDGAGGWSGWVDASDGIADYDFDLEPWVASGQLRWIAPGDPDAELRTGLDGCPFVGLTGPRAAQTIFQGVAQDG